MPMIPTDAPPRASSDPARIKDSLVPVRRRIADLRRRIRRRFILDGVVHTVATALAILAGSFVFDRMLELPVGVRAVILFGGLAAVLVTFLRRVVRPLSVRLSDEDLALALESRWPDLRDRFISALQFARQMEDPENEESTALMMAVLDETADLARDRRFRAAFTSKSLRVAGAVAGVLLLASVITAAARPDLVSIWAQRALLGSVQWPRATTLVVLDLDPDEPLVVTRGDDLTVIVEAQGDVPDVVKIRYRSLDDDEVEDSRRMYRLPETKNRFQYEFREIPRSFAFSVTGGDDDDDEPVYRVRALKAPGVESIAAHCEFPSYTRRRPETVTTGDFEVPAGTKVRFTLFTNMLVKRAEFIREGGAGVPMEIRDAKTRETSFTVEQSFQYSILLVGPEDQRNRIQMDTYRVTAIPDRRPEIRLLAPTSRDALSPTALLPLKVLATDNYGIEVLDLVWRVGLAGEDRTQPIRNASPAGGREVVAFDPMEVAAFKGPDGRPLAEGDLLLLSVMARDNNGLEDRTPEAVRLEIAPPDEVERRLGQHQVALREDASGAFTIQKDARESVALLVGDIGPGESLDRAAVDRLRDAQILQGRVTRKTAEFLAGIQRVLNGYVFNRLGGNPVAGEAMLRIYLDHLSRDRTNLSRVYKSALYDDIVAAYRRGEIFDPEILGILVEILEVGSNLSRELSPRAHQLVSGLVRGEADDPAVALRQIDEVQGACVEEFSRLMDMMKRWETYHEFVLRVRVIQKAQEEIIDRARTSVGEDGERGR